MRSLVSVLVLSMAACGDDGGPAIDAAGHDGAAVDAAPDGPVDAPVDAAPDAAAAPLELTSTAISEGGTIPTLYTCRGANVSPPLAWNGGPAVPGYAVVLTDTSNGLVHSIIWDIPGDATSLPENVAKVYAPPVPAGAKQPLAYDNQTRGYLGPCPPSQHTYQHALYAVDVHPLPGLGMASTRAQVLAAIRDHDTAMATLTATFTP